MKIAWLQDLPLNMGIGGGAQLNDEAMVNYGRRKLGHTIDIITPGNDIDLKKYDLRIVSNCVSFKSEVLDNLPKPYVVFHHDNIHCKYRAFYPRIKKCKKCKYAPKWKKLFLNSKINIFLSPLHLEVNSFTIPELKDHPHAFVPSSVDLEKFKANNKIKMIKNTVIGINCLFDFKGKDRVLDYIKKHKNLRFYLYGARQENIEIPKNAKLKEIVDNDKLPEILGKYEYLIHMPQNDAFCRVVAEYLLCNPKGKLICTDTIGLLSYDIYTNGKIDRSKLRKIISNAQEKFWNIVIN